MTVPAITIDLLGETEQLRVERFLDSRDGFERIILLAGDVEIELEVSEARALAGILGLVCTPVTAPPSAAMGRNAA